MFACWEAQGRPPRWKTATLSGSIHIEANPPLLMPRLRQHHFYQRQDSETAPTAHVSSACSAPPSQVHGLTCADQCVLPGRRQGSHMRTLESCSSRDSIGASEGSGAHGHGLRSPVFIGTHERWDGADCVRVIMQEWWEPRHQGRVTTVSPACVSHVSGVSGCSPLSFRTYMRRK